MWIRVLLVTILAITTTTRAADIIPSTNRIDWTLTAGVEGGIPFRTTIYTTLSSTVTVSQLNGHIAACPSNQVVKLDAGTYTLSGDLVPKTGVTLRGSGAATLLVMTDQIDVGTSLGRANINISSGYTSGSTNITLASSPTDLGPGNTIIINEANNTNYVHPWGYEDNMTAPLLCTYCDDPDGGARVRGGLHRVVSIAGADLVIWPPIYGPSYQSALTPRINYAHPLDPPAVMNNQSWVGFEDLAISNSAVTAIRFEQAANCWLSNVTFHCSVGSDPEVEGYIAHRISVVHCDFLGYTATASGITPTEHTDGWLIENNLFRHFYQSLIFVGRGGGHVVAYNYSLGTNASTALIAEMGAHGAHSQFVLWEGNKFDKIHLDSIHGSASSHTLFRNYIRGQRSDTTFGAGCINVDSWNYHMNIVGNVLGVSGSMSGWRYKEVSPGGAGTNSIFAWGYSGYNPFDTGTQSESTARVYDNYDYVTAGVLTASGETLPNSLFYVSKPGWFGSLTYPAIGPDATGFHANQIPAEYRYLTGQEPLAETTQPSRPTRIRGIRAR